MDDVNQQNDPLTEAVITIIEDHRKTDETEETFSRSKDWFTRFKSRSNNSYVKFGGEPANADIAAVADFPKEFQGYVE